MSGAPAALAVASVDGAASGAVVHRLWILGALGCAGASLAWGAAAWRRERALRRRITALTGLVALGGAESSSRRWARGVPWARGWRPLAAVAAGWVLLGGWKGLLAGCAAGWALHRARARSGGAEGAADRRERAVAERQLPLAADLLAACLAAGAGPREAAEVVGDSLGGPVGARLARAGAELRLGGDPGAAWGPLAGIPGARPLADCLERAARTGAPAAEPVSRLATALRADRSREAAARAQRATVLITAPVGLCFLPAFLAVGVAPVVIGLASGLLSGG
ncbi:type II secretion system F family protein [Streptomyces sp. NPDC097619]|uniref:type II secretion system F family protein n=1 Tax=Streptomyces sp. NPDC097619 TaxID=3157228 RepID=UPI0033244C59